MFEQSSSQFTDASKKQLHDQKNNKVTPLQLGKRKGERGEITFSGYLIRGFNPKSGVALRGSPATIIA